MAKVVNMINAWLNDLRMVAVDLGTEHDLVHSSLLFCHDIVEALHDTGSGLVLILFLTVNSVN